MLLQKKNKKFQRKNRTLKYMDLSFGKSNYFSYEKNVISV